MSAGKSIAVLEALFVTLLWSTSWVLIKVGLQRIPALSFAGLRYVLAFMALAAFAALAGKLAPLRRLTRGQLARLALYGVIFFAVTQGSQFLGLYYLPAASVSVLLNFTPLVVALAGIPLLGERPCGLQWLGIGVFLSGVGLFFLPFPLKGLNLPGAVVMIVGLAANSFSTLYGRKINREAFADPLTVTLVSMGVGSALLLGAGTAVQGLPPLTGTDWLIVLWLAVVNTALAFTLWNRALRRLEASEAGMINCSMLAQITLMAWVFLGEPLTGRQWVAVFVVSAGVALSQLKNGRRRGSVTPPPAASA
ncbi:MAG: EamA family transporter [Acidobacteria bacterium]|nr:EamA family transporter [Acidobacteriota bacterium]